MAKAKAKTGIAEKIGKEIDAEIEKEKCGFEEKKHHHHHGTGGGAVYGLGFIGALVFYIQHATSFGMGLLGVLKAIVWPAILIYKFLSMAGM